MHIRLLVLAVVLLTLASLAQAQEETGRLKPLSGEVLLRESESADWQRVTETIPIEDGVEIQTDASGRALLTYGEGLSTEILGNTHLIVDEIQYSEEDIEIKIQVLVGDTFNTIDEELPEDSKFEVHMPAVSAVTRGAQWYTFTASNGDSLISTVDGALVTEQAFLQNSVSLTAEGGQSLMITQDGSIGWRMNSLLISLETEETNVGDDRFGFTREVSCLSGGFCNNFCSQPGSAPLCDSVSESGFLNCSERVSVDKCAQILAERPAATRSKEAWRTILADRITDEPPPTTQPGQTAAPVGPPPGSNEGANPPGRGNQPPGEDGPPSN